MSKPLPNNDLTCQKYDLVVKRFSRNLKELNFLGKKIIYQKQMTHFVGKTLDTKGLACWKNQDLFTTKGFACMENGPLFQEKNLLTTKGFACWENGPLF